MSNITDFFPFPEYREFQKEALLWIEENLKNGIKNIILEASTGFGKSPAAVAVLKYVGNGYIVTTQKILQHQYENDFKDLFVMKGRANYMCKRDRFLNCAKGKCVEEEYVRDGEIVRPVCREDKIIDCKYMNEKRYALGYDFVLHNFAYFLRETTFAKQFLPRKILIIDEAHTIESVLLDFIEINMNHKSIKKLLNISIPFFNDSVKSCSDWLADKCSRVIREKESEYENSKIMKLRSGSLSSKEADYINMTLERLDELGCKIRFILRNLDCSSWILSQDKVTHDFKLLPLNISKFSENYLLRFGEQRLFISATILDKQAYCESVGIDEKETVFKSIGSTFKKENRKINIFPHGKMGMKDIDNSLPKIVYGIIKILKKHKKQKGIIHCVSYKISNYIEDTFDKHLAKFNDIKKEKSKADFGRLLFHDRTNREKIIDQHLNSKKPTVIVSPSLKEGIDLYDDRSRFQILCKIPYPSLADKQIAAKMKINPRWYIWKTCIDIVQSCGRSVRNHNDYADTYILDSCWDNFFHNNEEMFPQWFKEAIVYMKMEKK